MVKKIFFIFIVFSVIFTMTCWQGEKHRNILCGNGGKIQNDSIIDYAIKISLKKLRKSVYEVADTTLFPTYGTKGLKWKLDGPEQWTSGFYPGCLWLGYELSGDPEFKKWARQWTSSLESEKDNPETHDLGFKFMCTYGNGLRLGNKELNEKYTEVLLQTAKTLAERYNPELGCLSSNWDAYPEKNSYPVIIDIMMNLDLLLWASENGGQPYWKEYAVSHAKTTAREFIRPDSGTYHVVRFDSITGNIINKGTIQGEGSETTWARGHAWGTYGMVVMYRYTRDKQFLDVAMQLADYFIKNVGKDHVSMWDFHSDIKAHDVSATCVVSSALLEMLGYLDDENLLQHYYCEAEAMLLSLCQEPYFLVNKNTNCLLDLSTHHLPVNSNVDVPSSFADYYFLEALIRYKALNNYEL